jgi:hypothetical protein
MNGVIPPLPNTPSWRGAQLKEAQGQLYLYLLQYLWTARLWYVGVTFLISSSETLPRSGCSVPLASRETTPRTISRLLPVVRCGIKYI